MRTYLLYCDGSCLGNPGPGGWAYRVSQGQCILREQSGTEQSTTNNRMELRAAIEGLNSFPAPSTVMVISDSRYLISGMTELLPLWKLRNWRSSNGTAIQNQALWQELLRAASRHTVSWHWVRGHSGIADQESVDRLAAEAANLAARAA
jgi:ribonuclease HI